MAVLTEADFQQQLEDYKVTIKDKTMDELKDIEQELIAEFDKLNDTRKDTQFNLPKDGWKEMSETVCYFLDKLDVAWNVGFALIGIYDFWKAEKNPKKIPFSVFELTIQKLGDVTYKGYSEWTRICALNKWFEPIHPDYAEIVMGMRLLGAKHSLVQDAMGLNTPIVPQEEM